MLEYFNENPPTFLILGSVLRAFGGASTGKGSKKIPTTEELAALHVRFNQTKG